MPGGTLLACVLRRDLAGDDYAAPKISTFASAEDLNAELKFLAADLEKAVANEEDYKDQVEGRLCDGNTITLIAIAVGLHDQDSPLKAHAKAIAAAARKLAETTTFATTKQAVADLTAAIQGEGKGTSELKWGKVSKLVGLMKEEVPAINNNLKKSLRRFKKRAAEVSANAATMALIAENATLYVADTKKPTEGKKWTEFASQMRAAAIDLAAKAHAGDEPARRPRWTTSTNLATSATRCSIRKRSERSCESIAWSPALAGHPPSQGGTPARPLTIPSQALDLRRTHHRAPCAAWSA